MKTRYIIRTLCAPIAFMLAFSATAQGAFSFVSGTCTGGTGTSGTTTTISSTGADLMVAAVTFYEPSTAPSINFDTYGNTWVAETQWGGAGNANTIFYHVYSPTTGGAHAVGFTGGFGSACIAAFSGSTSSALDQQNGNGSASSTTITTGSVTPTQANELVLTSFGTFTAGPYTTPSGFTLISSAAYASGVSCGVAIAYQIQTSATADNPTWTAPTANLISARCQHTNRQPSPRIR